MCSKTEVNSTQVQNTPFTPKNISNSILSHRSGSSSVEPPQPCCKLPEHIALHKKFRRIIKTTVTQRCARPGVELSFPYRKASLPASRTRFRGKIFFETGLSGAHVVRFGQSQRSKSSPRQTICAPKQLGNSRAVHESTVLNGHRVMFGPTLSGRQRSEFRFGSVHLDASSAPDKH